MTGFLEPLAKPRAMLCCTDAYPFAVGLMASWQLGMTVGVPGHAAGWPDDEGALWVGERGVAIPLLGGAAPSSRTPRTPVSPALTVFTSGTQGAPQGIDKQLSQLDGEIEALERAFGATLGDAVVLGTVSQQHLYGWLFRVAWPLAAGRAFVSEASLFPEGWFDETARHARVAWVSSPAFYRRLWPQLPWAVAAPHVVAAFSSGGALSEQVAAEVERGLGQPVREIFGSTETGGVATRAGQAAWRALPGVSLDVRAVGALLVRSPHLPSDQWHAMSDAAELHGDELRLLGRMDRVVKVEDKRVSLDELDAALSSSPLVAEASVVLLDARGRHEVGAAVVLSAEGLRVLGTTGRLALTKALRRTLPAHAPQIASIRRFRLVTSLPGTALGKVTRASLLELFAQPRPSMPRVLEVRPTESGVSLGLIIEPDLTVLDGHFPEAPIVAGVAQLDWAVRFARQYLSIPKRGYSRLEAVKFNRVMQPGMPVTLSLEWSAAKQRLAFTFTGPKGACSSGRVALGEARAR